MNIIEYIQPVVNTISYKRIINELKNFEYDYKLFIQENGYLLEFKLNNHLIKIIFSNNYPFKPPSKLFINSINSTDIYKLIMKLNPEIKECLCCQSYLYDNNWYPLITIKNDILYEINLIIKYKIYYFYKKLLKQIISKYTDQDMSYLNNYLLN
tara:strand:- start:193 stop:654 length:462 start_codon:yes stop_codon:yes gene_type:complete